MVGPELSGTCWSAPGSSPATKATHTHLLFPQEMVFRPTQGSWPCSNLAPPSPLSQPPPQGPHAMALRPPEWFPCLRMREAGVNVRHKEDMAGVGRGNGLPTMGSDPAGEGKEPLLTPALSWNKPIPRPHLSSCSHKQLWAARSGTFPA